MVMGSKPISGNKKQIVSPNRAGIPKRNVSGSILDLDTKMVSGVE
jgi:hypothetical protein